MRAIRLGVLAFCAAVAASSQSLAQTSQPNIIVIMGDDIGWSNIGVYNQGIMAGRTPNLDRMASEGMRFTDYYAEASCTAGRANFITGELPIRTGLTTVGQAGATVGIPRKRRPSQRRLKSMGYATGQFGKNHLRRPQRVPADGARLRRVLGLPLSPGCDGRPVPSQLSAGLIEQGGTAQLAALVWRREVDDPTVDPRWGKVGKQKIIDEGPLPPNPRPNIKYNMETVDEVIRDKALEFIDKAKQTEQAILCLAQPNTHARRDASIRKIRGDAHAGERLEHSGSRHGPAR